MTDDFPIKAGEGFPDGEDRSARWACGAVRWQHKNIGILLSEYEKYRSLVMELQPLVQRVEDLEKRNRELSDDLAASRSKANFYREIIGKVAERIGEATAHLQGIEK